MSLTDAAEMADDSKPKRSRGRRNNGGQHEPSEGGGDVEPARENADGGGRGRGRGGGGGGGAAVPGLRRGDDAAQVLALRPVHRLLAMPLEALAATTN